MELTEQLMLYLVLIFQFLIIRIKIYIKQIRNKFNTIKKFLIARMKAI